jgi:hypothetical protein
MPLRSLLAHQVEAASGIVSQASALSSIGPSELLWIAVSYAAFRSDHRSSSTGCSARTAHAARLITKLVELHTVDHPLNSSIPPIFFCSFPPGLASVPASLIMQLAAGRGPLSLTRCRSYVPGSTLLSQRRYRECQPRSIWIDRDSQRLPHQPSQPVEKTRKNSMVSKVYRDSGRE